MIVLSHEFPRNHSRSYCQKDGSAEYRLNKDMANAKDVSPDRDIDLMRRFEALKGGDPVVAKGYANVQPAVSQQQTALLRNPSLPGTDQLQEHESDLQKFPLTLADIQGSIGKRHNKNLADAQKKWIESLNSQIFNPKEESEEEAQREWVSQMQFAKVTPERSPRGDDRRKRSEAGSISSERTRYSHPPTSSSPIASPHKVPRPLTIKSTVLTPAAASFGFCEAPRITLNSLPITVTTVKDVTKPDKEFITDTGKTIKVVKLEEPPKYKKKVKSRSPQKMKAVIDIDASKNEERHKKTGHHDSLKSTPHHSSLQQPKLTRLLKSDPIQDHLASDVVEKYRLSLRTRNELQAAVSNQGTKSTHIRSDHKSPKKMKRSSSLPSGLNEKSESEPTSKHVRNYDVNETRNFIKLKQKEREERIAEEKRKKEIEAAERKKKMQQLRDTQRRIMQKIKKRTVHKIRSPSIGKNDQEKPNWVGPMESSAPTVLDSSFELVPPRPKSAHLSDIASGTITIKKKNRPDATPAQAPAEDKQLNMPLRHDDESKSASIVDQQLQSKCEAIIEQGIQPNPTAESESPDNDKLPSTDLELSNDQHLQLNLKRRAPDLVESATQINMDLDVEQGKLTPRRCKSRESTTSYCKRSKSSISEGVIGDKKKPKIRGLKLQGSSRFDQFLAEYVPTPEKKPLPRPETPAWLREMSQLPDQFNLINTLERALQSQNSVQAKKPAGPPDVAPSNPYSPSKKGPPVGNCSEVPLSPKAKLLSRLSTKSESPATDSLSNIRTTRNFLDEVMSNSTMSASSSQVSELALDLPQLKLDDASLSLSTVVSTSALSFGEYEKAGSACVSKAGETSFVNDSPSADLDYLFPQTGLSTSAVKTQPKQLKVLGEVLENPLGVVTERKPLRHRYTKDDAVGALDFPNFDLNLNNKSTGNPAVKTNLFDCQVDQSSSEVYRSLSTSSFSSMKEGSYVFSRSETSRTVDGGASYRKFVRPFHRPQGNQSDHSSDSISEIVKVSRTVSRGSTVLSEETSELQNTVSVSSKMLQFNPTMLQNEIQNEIRHLDRVNESLESIIECGKTAVKPLMDQSERSGPSNEQTTVDVITVRPKSPLPSNDLDNTLVAVSPRSIVHSRDHSVSSHDASVASGNGTDVTKFTLEMFDTLIRDEKLRSDQHVANLKLRMKNLCGRTRKDFELIESQRKELIETGHEDEAKELKRKQRGQIMKMDEEYAELKRLEAMEHRACQERCILLKQQQQIIRSLLQSQRDPYIRSSRGSLRSSHMSQLDDTVRCVGNEKSSDVIDRKKRELREREESLRERRKNIESLIAWKKRIDQEEKNLREKEKLIAQSSFSSQLPESVVERGTSPVAEMKDIILEDPVKPSIGSQAMPVAVTSHSESEIQPKDYYSDSFEHSSIASESMAGPAASHFLQGSPFLTKAMRLPMLKTPLSPRVTIMKRRHSSGSDESMLLSQNDTLSEPSDVDVRVSALEQQLRHRKSELAKLKREYHKNQKERLRSTEKNLINQIHLYDSYIEQVKTEIKELENTDVRVTKPQIKQPKFERRQSDKFVVRVKSKDQPSDSVVDAKTNETVCAFEDGGSLVSFLDKGPSSLEDGENKDATKGDVSSISTAAENIDPLVTIDLQEKDLEIAVKNHIAPPTDDVLAPIDPSRDSESSTSEKDFSIEEIIEKAERSRRLDSLDEINTDSFVATETGVITELGESVIAKNKFQLSLVTPSEVSENPGVTVDDASSLKLEEISSVMEDIETAQTEAKSETSGSIPECIDSAMTNFEAEPSTEISPSANNAGFEVLSEPKLAIDDTRSDKLTQSKSISNEMTSDHASILSHYVTDRQEASIPAASVLDNTDTKPLEMVLKDLPPKLSLSPGSKIFGDNVDQFLPINLFNNDTQETSYSRTVDENKVIESSTHESYSVIESGLVKTSADDENVSDAQTSRASQGSTVEEIEEAIDSEPTSLKTSDGASKQISELAVPTKSARKRLNLEDLSKSVQELTEYDPTMKIEGQTRSICELIVSKLEKDPGASSVGSAISEALLSDEASVMSKIEEEETLILSADGNVLEEIDEEASAEEQLEESEKSALDTNHQESNDDSVLEKLDFGLDEILKDQHSEEAGDHDPVEKLKEVLEDKRTELGQGDEPPKDLEMRSFEADSLEGPFVDFNDSFNSVDMASHLEKPNSERGSKIEPLSDDAVKEILQGSFECSDKIWESRLEQIEKSNAGTPLLTALQREREQNFNVESISNLIYDSFVDDATSAALKAYTKKKQLSPEGKGGYEGTRRIGNSTVSKEVGDNDKFWLGDDFTLQAAHEAEQLRLQQLQIEQEIEQLEQAQEVVPYYYVREIPNKPPPPYTPPKPSPPSKEETVSRVIQGGEILWDVEANGGDPSAVSMPEDFLPSLQDDEPYRLFLFDLAKELYLKLKPRPTDPSPPWIVQQRRGKPLPPIRCKEDLLKYMEKEAKLVFGFEPRVLRESLIMKWTRKKRDHVDEILVRELQESEAEWRDFTVEENIIKNRIAESIIAEAFDDAVTGIAEAFMKKLNKINSDLSVERS